MYIHVLCDAWMPSIREMDDTMATLNDIGPKIKIKNLDYSQHATKDKNCYGFDHIGK